MFIGKCPVEHSWHPNNYLQVLLSTIATKGHTLIQTIIQVFTLSPLKLAISMVKYPVFLSM